ncbi:MAG: hypothetical protein NTZ05_20385 [Chloroflexi bacterium]|nr:hypothetical protein [Chloroflexota bacterium]
MLNALFNLPRETVGDYTRCGLAIGWLAATAIMYITSIAARNQPPNLDGAWWAIGVSALSAFIALEFPAVLRGGPTSLRGGQGGAGGAGGTGIGGGPGGAGGAGADGVRVPSAAEVQS